MRSETEISLSVIISGFTCIFELNDVYLGSTIESTYLPPSLRSEDCLPCLSPGQRTMFFWVFSMHLPWILFIGNLWSLHRGQMASRSRRRIFSSEFSIMLYYDLEIFLSRDILIGRAIESRSSLLYFLVTRCHQVSEHCSSESSRWIFHESCSSGISMRRGHLVRVCSYTSYIPFVSRWYLMIARAVHAI